LGKICGLHDAIGGTPMACSSLRALGRVDVWGETVSSYEKGNLVKIAQFADSSPIFI